MKIKILFILILIFISSCYNYDNIKKKSVCFEKNCFVVEIADTNYKREFGLMNRTFLDKDKGMLFVFDKEDYYSFWMKDTLIPLDIIWINSNKEVVFIKENALPCNLFEKKLNQKYGKCETYISDKKAKYVLEINNGLVKELNIKVGDKVNF